ncbi:hypothetical protein WME94_34575 [Sorangium sp. So ce429]
MQSFRQMLTAASQEQPTMTRSGTPWDGVLGEFCDWLNETYGEFLVAALTDSSAPQVRHLKLWPRGQRNAQSIVLSVYITEKTARILGRDMPDFKTMEEFQEYLASFVGLPAFRASIEALKESASQPVVGALRMGASWKTPAILADITVEVPPDQQRLLADASEEASQRVDQLYVKPVGPTGLGRGRYAAQNELSWLVAGGYALYIENHAPEPDGRIRLSGVPVPSSKLD